MKLQKFFLLSFFLSSVSFSMVASDIDENFTIEGGSSTSIDVTDVNGFEVKANGNVTIDVPYKIIKRITFANKSPNQVSGNLKVIRKQECIIISLPTTSEEKDFEVNTRIQKVQRGLTLGDSTAGIGSRAMVKIRFE
jgi:hypothetical protein